MNATPKRETLEAIYTILVTTCGAGERERSAFICHHLKPDMGGEWRFQGLLGFGGKLKTHWWPPRVDCYQEDLTEERQVIIAKANQQLARFTLA